MKEKLLNIIKYFVLWLCYFQVSRLVFFAITKDFSSKYSLMILFKSMLYGLWLDMSVAGYFTMFFSVFLLGGLFFNSLSNKVFKISNIVLLVLCTIIVAGNAVLYTYWATPLDFNALKYLKTPAEAAASVNWLKIILPVLICSLPAILLYFLLFKIKINEKLNLTFWKKISNLSVLVFVCLLLVIPVRGGIGIVPVNLSKVYFYKEIYPNHAAYNPVWNVLYSFTKMSNENSYSYMDDNIAEQKFNSLFTGKQKIEDKEKLLNTNRPNVVVIVLESYLQRLFYYKYKGVEIIPNLNKIAVESIQFTNLYSSGDRSDRGLVSIFSGYPAMPKSAIVQFPNKFTQLPSVFRDFEKINYHTSFYYGGNLDFANLRSYFISAGVSSIVSENDFNGNVKKGKWGVHDKYTLNRFFEDIIKQKQPFFSSIFTLSNHEPFDLPEKYIFGRGNGNLEYMSAANYADKYVGKFIDSLKKTKLWQNTLVIITADHGVARLGIDEMQVPEKFHIPMIWTGGAIKKPLIIDKLCSQMDIPLMLLDQCQITPTLNYEFSNSIFRNGSVPFAVYFFNNGFGFLRNHCISVYDNVSGRYWTNNCIAEHNGIFGKAYLQVLSKDFNK